MPVKFLDNPLRLFHIVQGAVSRFNKCTYLGITVTESRIEETNEREVLYSVSASQWVKCALFLSLAPANVCKCKKIRYKLTLNDIRLWREQWVRKLFQFSNLTKYSMISMKYSIYELCPQNFLNLTSLMELLFSFRKFLNSPLIIGFFK